MNAFRSVGLRWLFIPWLMVCLTILPFHGYADEMSSVGRSAATFGQRIVTEYNKAPATFENGTVSVPTLTNGKYSHTGSSEVDTNAFYFGSSSETKDEMASLYPDSAPPSAADAQGASNSIDAINGLGKDSQSAMWSDATSGSPTTIMGGAYEVLLNAYNAPKPDLRNDPDLQATRDIYENIDEISASFADCSTQTSYTPKETTRYLPNIKTCERILDLSTECRAQHDIDAHEEPLKQPLKIRVLYWDGSGENEWCTLRVLNPSTNRSMDWAGHFPDGMYGTNNPLNNDTCALEFNKLAVQKGSQVYDKLISIGVFIDEESKTPASSSYPVNFDLAGCGGGPGCTSYVERFATTLKTVVDRDAWSPEDCIAATEGMKDGFATGTVTCAESYPMYQGCAVVNGAYVCDRDIAAVPPLLSRLGIGKFCKSVDIKVDYKWYKGQYCFTAADGSRVCSETGTSPKTTCETLEKQESCKFIDSQCVPGSQLQWWQDFNRTCYLTEETWDCPTPVTVTDYTSETKFNCAGPVRCMGSDCIDPKKTQSTGFADAMARMNVAQFMTQDMNCVDGGSCKVFAGKHHTCKIAVGGVQDCCDVPTMTNAGTYIAAAMAVSKLDSALMAMDNSSVVKGAYQTLREPVANTVSSVTKPFTSYAENITGQVKEFFKPADEWLKQMKEQISTKIEETFDKLFTDTAKDMTKEAAGGGGGSQVGGTTPPPPGPPPADAASSIMADAGAAFSTLSTIYTAYVVTVMVVQAIYKCEEEEFMLASKKDTNSCHYVGSYCDQYTDGLTKTCLVKKESYCCFNSPLSRIINEQVLPQFVPWWAFWVDPWGSEKAPNCSGMTFEQVQQVDWSKVKLDEWVTMLNQNMLMPTPDTINLEAITGAGSSFSGINPGQTTSVTNPDGTVTTTTHSDRMNVQERSEERVNGINVDDIRIESGRNTLFDVSGTSTPP